MPVLALASPGTLGRGEAGESWPGRSRLRPADGSLGFGWSYTTAAFRTMPASCAGCVPHRVLHYCRVLHLRRSVVDAMTPPKVRPGSFDTPQ